MANRYTDYPEHQGEASLARQLAAFDDPHLHLWFALDYIPGVRDIDCVIWHENVGVFIVEIKAVNLPMVEEFGLDVCRIRGRNGTETPQRQAYAGQECLRRFLAPQMRAPWLASTACWPIISRSSWQRNWNEKVIRELADCMIFEEDITSGPERLKRRLEHIYRNPPIRSGSNRAFVHNAKQLKEFANALRITATRTPAPSDLQKLRIIEDKVTTETTKLVPADKVSKVFFYGHPGTGKTFRLLQIGMHHALRDRRVLFACFNMVLAADTRRILAHSHKLRASHGEFKVVDIWDEVIAYKEQYKICEHKNDFDQWGELIVDDLRNRKDQLPKYDTILIDESQDMKDWMLEMLELHANEQTTVCVAAGAGQELYGQAGAWLAQFRSHSVPQQLRRNFRNTRPVFQAAQVFYEAQMKIARIEPAVRKFTDKKSKHEQLLFEFAREEGNPPSIVYVNDEELEPISNTDPSFPQAQFECMVREYSRLIMEQLARLEGDERPIDLLVLVPSESGSHKQWVVAALEASGISFMDYTVKTKRRDIAPPDKVRLCTFHSARGIEGYRVLVFGFETIDRLVDETDAKVENLGYIVLSRSLFECVIAVWKRSPSEVVPFLTSILNKLQT